MTVQVKARVDAAQDTGLSDVFTACRRAYAQVLERQATIEEEFRMERERKRQQWLQAVRDAVPDNLQPFLLVEGDNTFLTVEGEKIIAIAGSGVYIDNTPFSVATKFSVDYDDDLGRYRVFVTDSVRYRDPYMAYGHALHIFPEYKEALKQAQEWNDQGKMPLDAREEETVAGKLLDKLDRACNEAEVLSVLAEALITALVTY